MKHKRITKLLKKISVLNESIAEDDEFSSLERDHMVNYIKELYEEAKGEAFVEVVEAQAIKDTEEDQEKYEIVEEEIVEEEIVEALKAEKEEVEEEKEEVEELIEPEVEEVKVAEVQIPLSNNPEMEAIFESMEGDDLSDRLSTMPISDLTKSMGINEKIFTVKELFGGDQSEFNNMMQALNGLSSFDEAKQVLINSVAMKYDWSNEKKMKKAEHFVRLVRRRYM